MLPSIVIKEIKIVPPPTNNRYGVADFITSNSAPTNFRRFSLKINVIPPNIKPTIIAETKDCIVISLAFLRFLAPRALEINEEVPTHMALIIAI